MKKILSKIDLIKNYKKLWPYIKPYRFRAIVALLISIPIGSMDAVIAYSLKPFMDEVMVNKNISSSTLIPIFIIFFSVFQSFLNYSSAYLNSWVGGKITTSLKSSLYKTLLRKDVKFFDNASSGDIIFRFNQDVNLACAGLISNVKNLTVKSCSTISLMIVLIYNSWQLAIIAILAFLISFIPLSQIRRKITEATRKSVTTASKVMTHYNEAFNGNRTISAYNLHKKNSDDFITTLNNVFKLELKMLQKTALVSPIMQFVVSVGIAGVIWFGSFLILHDKISPGSFISFITALLMLYQPIKTLGNTCTSVIGSFLAIDRVFELFETTSEIKDKPDAQHLLELNHKIEYRNLSFSYNKKSVLKNINLTIKKGETVAFVGTSGAGKTTLVNLLPRFYDVKHGGIFIDDIDIKNIFLDDLRNLIAVVFQDNFLFSGTIIENIILDKEYNEEKFQEAINNACLKKFISELEHGVNTEIGERGVLLSGGQKQRVAIARAFYKNAPIVVLDEATSALDTKSEIIVQEAIYNLMRDRTVFIIAHRLSTIEKADRIILLSEGEIIEEGSHTELLNNKKSMYNSFYNAHLN
jgi:ATP-binding cassette, subfamily B, bacterial MsbA